MNVPVGQAGPNATEERLKLISSRHAEAHTWLDNFRVDRFEDGEPLRELTILERIKLFRRQIERRVESEHPGTADAPESTKETYTREQLMSDEVIEAVLVLAEAREIRSEEALGRPPHRHPWVPDEMTREEHRAEIREDLTAAFDAIDKGKGGEDD